MPNTVPLEQALIEPSDERRQATPKTTARVLHVINGEHYSGAERVQDLLAKELPGLGFEVHLVCLKPGRFPELRQAQDAPLYEVPMRGRFDLRPVWRLVRLIRRQGYSLLHAHTPRTAMLAAIASLLTGVPLVYHVHSPASHDSTRGWRNRINALVERIALGWASAVIAVSESLGRHMRGRGFSGDTLSVVPNGVPCRRPRPPRPEGRREWTLGTVALFRPRKGTEVLLEALAKLRAEGLPVKLRAVGSFETPEYQRQIRQKVHQLGLADAVHWTGFARDVDRQLAQMDLFVLPSLFGEGLPMVVLEAMSAGVPVVAARVEGIPESIRHGRDGLLVEPGDADDLARAIGRVIRAEVDWNTLRHNGLERHAQRFSDRSMAAGVAEVYRRVLKAG